VDDSKAMGLALDEARAALAHGDVPIGAIALQNGEVIGRAHNERELRKDPTAHAEMLVLQAAAEHVGGWRLSGVTVVVTLEPCVMCAGAVALARVPRLVYAAPDPKGGAVGGVIDLFAPPASRVVNHRPRVEGGLLAEEAAAMLEAFFAARR
jgi:tRNA(adenine34) deaminase